MKGIIVVFFLLLLTNISVAAQSFKDDKAFIQLKESIGNNQYDLAWQKALSLESTYLGDANFDFLYGLAALNVDEFERAVYAFERVVANQPLWLDAQYYLATAYYAMKNYPGVIALTQPLIQTEITPATLKTSATRLQGNAEDALHKQSLFIKHAVDLSLGHDSNVNAGTREDNIFLPLLNQDIILSDDSKENSENYAALGYKLEGTKALTQSSQIIFSGLSKIHYFTGDSRYNRLSIRTNLHYKKAFDDFTAQVGIRATPLWLNDSYYRTQYGATFGLSKAMTKQWLVRTDVFVGKTKNDVNQLLSTDDVSIQLSSHYLTKNWRHGLVLSYAQEDSEFVRSQHNDRNTGTVSYLANYAINQQWLASASISYQHQAYQFEHPFFFVKRVDKMWLLGTSIQYQDSHRWSYRLSANIQDKESNIALFSYQRAELNFTARLSF